jgi:poly-beta-1,6-N-acetyl-D-glucosamine synthase
MRAMSFLSSLDLITLIEFFWFTVLFEIPRYVLGAFFVPFMVALRRKPDLPPLTLSVVVAGNNGARALPAFAQSIAEQTLLARLGQIQLIVVDDGSTDNMFQVARDLRDSGKLDVALRLEQRGGKNAAINLALAACTGEIIIICDIDTSFNRDAFAELVLFFADTKVGAVSGNLAPRNANASLITRNQAIEYAVSISLGRCVSDAFGTLQVVSGAFGAFRRSAIEAVGGEDPEAGEDVDLTMKLRRSGWRIRFAPNAHALTDVPETLAQLTAQRLRWDRVLVTIWLRKYRANLNPRLASFRLIDALAFLDIFYFDIALGPAYLAYLIWLAYYIGNFAVVILGAMLLGDAILNTISLFAAAAIGIQSPLRLFIYLPFYTFMQSTVVKLVRTIAVFQELALVYSRKDSYVPRNVLKEVDEI